MLDTILNKTKLHIFTILKWNEGYSNELFSDQCFLSLTSHITGKLQEKEPIDWA